MSLKSLEKLQMCFPHTKTSKKNSYQYMTANTFKNEETLHQRFLMPVKPFATAPGLLKGYDSP